MYSMQADGYSILISFKDLQQLLFSCKAITSFIAVEATEPDHGWSVRDHFAVHVMYKVVGKRDPTRRVMKAMLPTSLTPVAEQ